MTPRDRKLTLLRLLGEESEPVSLSLLTHKLNYTATDRTVRRWMYELIEEGLVKKSGHTKDAKYVVIKQKGEVLDSISSCFSSKSLRAIAQIKRPVYEREPVAYNDQWFDSYKPNINSYFSDKVRAELKSAGQRANERDPAGTYAHQIFNRLLIDLSYNSSRLEGCTYSLLDTERLLLHGNAPDGKLDEEKVMILNHKEAIRYLVDNASRLKVSSETIFTLHYLLSDGLVEPECSGKVRNHSVRVSGSTYIPFEDPNRLKIQMNRIAEKAAVINDPFEQSFFLLVHISYLQAFADVNKRTARLSANIPLIAKNFVPLSFNDVDLIDYRSSIIAIYELQDIHPLADLYIYSYMRTCAAYDATVKAIGFDEIRVRYRQERRAVVREVILQGLTGGKMHGLILREAKNNITEIDRQGFIDDIMEDLEQMDESRLAGLGVTPQQLQEWQRLHSKE